MSVMSFFFNIILFYIGGTFIYTVLLSLAEANKAKKRTKKRSQIFPTAPSVPPPTMLEEVEKRWTRKVGKRNSPSTQQLETPSIYTAPLTRTPLGDVEAESFADRRATRIKRETIQKDTNVKQTKVKKTPPALSVLNHQSLAQVILAKEILDKPLSIRKRS